MDSDTTLEAMKMKLLLGSPEDTPLYSENVHDKITSNELNKLEENITQKTSLVDDAMLKLLIGGPDEKELYPKKVLHSVVLIETHTIIQDVTRAIEVAQVCLGIGQFVFAPIAPILEAISGVGTCITTLLNLVPQEKEKDQQWEQVENELGRLGRHIEQLSQTMTSKFDDLKSFLTELNFLVEVVTPTSSLTRYMQDCLIHTSTQAIQNFKAEYLKNSPLSLAHKVLSYLDNKATNPLKMAMDVDPLKTKNTFNKWFNTIDGVFGQFLFLEAFAAGIVHQGDNYNAERLKDRSQQLFNVINNWKEDFMKAGDYWPFLKNLASEYLERNEDRNTTEKANGLKSMLETILTYDAFFIVVTEHWHDDAWRFRFHVVNKIDKCIEIYGPGNGNCLIYRSKKANFVSEEKLLRMKHDVKRTHVNDEMTHMLQLAPEALFRSYETVEGMAPGWYEPGFVASFDNLNQAICGANCNFNDGEPGAWTRIKIFPDLTVLTNNHLVVGYI